MKIFTFKHRHNEEIMTIPALNKEAAEAKLAKLVKDCTDWKY